MFFFFFSSRRRHTRCYRDWSSDVCSSDLIVRVEVLGGRFLYGIRIHTLGDTFNLCPADVCQTVDGVELVRAACPADAPRTGLTVEGYAPPPSIVAQVERVMAAAGVEVGGV